MKKQILAFVLALAATLALVACGSPTGPTPAPTPAPAHGTEDLGGSSSTLTTSKGGLAGICAKAPSELGDFHFQANVTPGTSGGVLYLIPFGNLQDSGTYCEPSGLCHGNVIGQPMVFPAGTTSLSGAWTIPSIQQYCVEVQLATPANVQSLQGAMWLQY